MLKSHFYICPVGESIMKSSALIIIDPQNDIGT